MLLFAAWTLGGSSPSATADPVDDAVAGDGLFAVFETSLGNFACALDFEKAPVTVGNFVGLAEGTKEFRDPRNGQLTTRRFYDGLKFHRVLPGFVAQGGDPRGDGTGGPGYEFADEIDPSLTFDTAGVLAMASAGPDRNGSQFFITLAPAPHLNGRHSIFGHVVAGMDVVQSMARQPRLGPDRSTPVTDIEIRKLRIVRNGERARAFDAAAAFAQAATMHERRAAAKRAAADAFRAALAQDEARATRSPSGLRYIVLVTGQGDPPKPGDTISTHCTGYLASDGTRFWSTYDREQPFRVAIGLGKVIKGWEEAFLQMRPGEKRRLIIPPELAYGPQGNPGVGIPGNATLVFDVELLAVERR
jgi:peptidyl-prolyl cis-trans isomerase A (cyclophilin A)